MCLPLLLLCKGSHSCWENMEWSSQWIDFLQAISLLPKEAVTALTALQPGLKEIPHSARSLLHGLKPQCTSQGSGQLLPCTYLPIFSNAVNSVLIIAEFNRINFAIVGLPTHGTFMLLHIWGGGDKGYICFCIESSLQLKGKVQRRLWQRTPILPYVCKKWSCGHAFYI